jgi:broad specificity phosphatase PhoE
MKNIITIQHCESYQHLNNMVGGWTDWELTEWGKIQAYAIGRGLRKEIANPQDYVMYSSDLIRARQTAEIVGKHLGLTPILRNELREIYFGSATGKSMSWKKEHDTSYTKGDSILEYRCLPDAESLLDVYNRISIIVDEIISSVQENIIVVSHCAALGMFFCKWMQIDINLNYATLFKGEAGGVSVLQIDENNSRIMGKLNDISYWSWLK